MSEQQRPSPESIQDVDILRTMYETGADQLYYEETGKSPIENGERTDEAKEYAEKLLAPIDFEDRSNWRDNANLELKLSQASSKRLMSENE